MLGTGELLEGPPRVPTRRKAGRVDFSRLRIDLLGRDATGSYVVVMVAAQGGPRHVAEVLGDGWVRKHLAAAPTRCGHPVGQLGA
jgi:hypothetical protein